MGSVKSIGRPWIHEGIQCDNCLVNPIRGIRYKCKTCEKHNLCRKCHDTRGRDASHASVTTCNFLEIYVDSGKFYPPFQIRYYSCSSCYECPIQGRRYLHVRKPNYYLCGKCFDKGSEPAQDFLEVEVSKISPVYHFHKQCMQCGQLPISGIRFDSIRVNTKSGPNLQDDSLCLRCFDLKVAIKSIDPSSFKRVERPHVDDVVHIAVLSCFQCEEIPICGVAYCKSRGPKEPRCVACYLLVDPKQPREYERLEPPCQFGRPPATAHKPDPQSSSTSDKSGDNVEVDKLKSRVDATVLREKPNVRWEDVAGLANAKQALQEAVDLPMKFPGFFQGDCKPWNAILLYGPPGTGKSYLAKALATETSSTFFSISGSDLISKWHGESEKLVVQLFEQARAVAPSIVFIDEIDSIASSRKENDVTSVKQEILVQMQGVGNNNDKVLVLGATNRPYHLDAALRRRFNKRIYIPLPEQSVRKEIVKICLKKTPHSLNNSDFEDLATKTEGFSASDIAVFVNDVLHVPLRKTKVAEFFRVDDDSFWYICDKDAPDATKTSMKQLEKKGLGHRIRPLPIVRADFEEALAKKRTTVNKIELEVHEKFTAEFGEEGTDGERSEWLRRRPWSDLAGLESAKRALYEGLVLPIKNNPFSDRNQDSWGSCLVYGPNGTGKTSLAHAVRTELKLTQVGGNDAGVDRFWGISGKQLSRMSLPHSQNLVTSRFQEAGSRTPSIIFIDDIDAVCKGPVDNGFSSDKKDKIMSTVIEQIQLKKDKVLILCATNAPHTLHPSLVKCFQKRIPIPLPDQPARKEIFKIHLAKNPHSLTLDEDDMEELAWKTHQFSPRDISTCVQGTLSGQGRKVKTSKFFKRMLVNFEGGEEWIPCDKDDPRAIETSYENLISDGKTVSMNTILAPSATKSDFESVLAKHSPTVSHADLGLHLRFTHEGLPKVALRLTQRPLGQ